MNGCYSYTVLLALVVTLMSFEFVCSNIILTSHHYNSQRTASAVLWYSRIKSIYNVFFFIHSIMRPFIHNNSTKPSLVVHNQNMQIQCDTYSIVFCTDFQLVQFSFSVVYSFSTSYSAKFNSVIQLTSIVICE